MRGLRRVARVVAWCLVIALGFGTALLVALRTAPGRRALLRVALPLVNARMAGHLSVGGVDGDLWHRVVLIDARLDDAEGVEAIYARRIEARIDLAALWYGRVHVRDLRVDGARLTLRHLRDNRLNVAALGKSQPTAADKARKAEHASKPFFMEIDHFHLFVDGTYHPPRGHEAHALEWPHGTFDIEGAAQVGSAGQHFRIDRFVSDARDPLQAHVELRAGLLISPRARPGGKAEIAFDRVVVTVTSDGAEIARLSPMLHPRGRWTVHAEGGGPLSRLRAVAIVSGPRGSVTVDGVLTRTDLLRWGANVMAAGIDPGADWDRLPHGNVGFVARAGGTAKAGEVMLERLTADAGGMHVDGHGHSDFGGHGDGVVHASIDSLAASLAQLGVKIGGVAQLDGRVAVEATLGRDAAGPRVDARVRAAALTVQSGKVKAKAGAVVVHAVVGPRRPMHVDLDGRALVLAGVGVAKRTQLVSLPVRAVHVELDGQPRRFSAAGGATLDNGTVAHFVARTAMRAHEVDATITALSIARGARHFVLDVPAEVRLMGALEAPHIVATAAGARVEAHLRFGRDRLTADAAVDAPELAPIGRLGGVALDGALHARVRLALAERLTIDAIVDGERLRGPHVTVARLHASLHSVELVGDARVEAEGIVAAGERLETLAFAAHGTPTRLAITLDGARDARARGGAARLHLALDGAWRTDARQLVNADLVVRVAELTLPRQAWRLAAPAHLAYANDAVTIAGVRVRSGVGELAVDGRVARGGIDVMVQLRDGDLEAVSRAAGRPGLLPPARWSGRVHVAGTMAAPLVEATLDARADKTVAWLGLGVNALSLRAFIDSRHAIVHADAQGRSDTRMVVDAHGVPRRDDQGRIAGVAATLDRIEFTAHGHAWQLRAPCTIDVGTRLAVDGCRLGAPGRGEIALAGSAPLQPASDGPLDVTLTTRHLDLRDLHALLAPGHAEPPKTDFEIHAHVGGTRKAPIAELQLSGRGSEIDEGGLPENVDYKVSARYADRRVRGQASARQHGTRLGIGATFDLPTTLDDEAPLSLALEARPVPFYKVRQLLPTAFANVKGFFSLRVRAAGTTRHPRVAIELHAPSWALDDLRDNNSVANLSYDGRELVVNSVTSFEAQGLIGSILRLHPPRNSGTVTMELRAPVDIVRLLRAPHDALHALVHDAPIVASAEVRNVELAKVPLQIVGFDAPLTTGRIDAKIRAGGTLHRPTLHADVRAIGLARLGLVDHLDLDGAVEWEGGRLQLTGRAALRGAPLLTFQGVAQLDGRRLFDGDHWRDGALDFDVDVPAYSLARLRNLQPRLHSVDGSLHARAQLRGTFGAPDLRIVAEGRDVGLAHSRFPRLDATARLHDARWTFDVGGSDAGGGAVRVAGELAHDWNAPLHLSIDARALDVGFLGALWEEIGDVGGRLDAHVKVAGSRAAPEPSGSARLDGGVFAFRGDPRRYTAAFDVRIAGGEAHLERLALGADTGTLEARGSARLDGILPTELTLAARAHAFTVAYGSASARFDADFAVAGDRTDQSFRGALKLSRGSIVLPELGELGAREELGGMPDVRFDDARARRDAGLRSAGKGAFVAVRVAGPLTLRSREADLDLAGELGVTIAGGTLGLDGVVEAQRGTVDLLGKRYDVERAQLAFGGSADDPELHLRVTRRVGRAMVAVVIEGTAQNPSVRLSCDPPIYDETQLTSLVLAGHAGTERIAVRDLNRQITGLLSAVVIRKIREQLAPGLPIDLLRPLDQQSYAEFSAAPLEVGRFVSDRVYVRYEQSYTGARLGRSAANAEEASAELQLGRGFQLSTTFGDAGVGGIYLFWTKRH